MTNLQCMQIALRRSSLDETLTAYKDDARLYLNDVIKGLEAEATWWWKFKSGSFVTTKTMTVTSPSGAFTAGETLTGGTSGATATLLADDTGGSLRVHSESTTAFTASETVTGGTSGQTATYSSITTTRLYTLATDVLSLKSAFNNTGDDLLRIAYANEAQRVDPDFSEEGTPHTMYVHGVDSTSGAVRVGLYPRDTTTNETIDYHYYSFTPDFTSGNDSDSLDVYVPAFLQPALYYGIAKLLQQEKGDEEGALVEENNYERLLAVARRQNLDALGDKSFRRRRQPPKMNPMSRGLDVRVIEGSL